MIINNMDATIHVPPDEQGDKAVMRMIPHLHQMAQSEMRAKRSGNEHDSEN